VIFALGKGKNEKSEQGRDDVFEPARAKRILDRLEFHYPPKHGSWLDMAEIELSVLDRQPLDRYIPTTEIINQETGAWESDCNQSGATVGWRFTTADARINFVKLYSAFHV
jgi:hypothetical protein